MISMFVPFGGITAFWKRIRALFWVAVGVLLWQYLPSYFIPRPLAVWHSLTALYDRGMLVDLWVSLWVVIRAGIFFAFPIGCILGYLYTIPWFKPPVLLLALMRNVMVNAIVAGFLMASLGGDPLKVITITFIIVVYFVSSLIQRIDGFPQAKVNHGITMRMSRWQILWHHIIRGSFHEFCYDFVPCLGMAWSMLSLVEGLARNEGGLGDLMLQVDKISSLSGIAALAAVSGVFGFGMWYLLRTLIRSTFRFATQVAVKS